MSSRGGDSQPTWLDADPLMIFLEQRDNFVRIALLEHADNSSDKCFFSSPFQIQPSRFLRNGLIGLTLNPRQGIFLIGFFFNITCPFSKTSSGLRRSRIFPLISVNGLPVSSSIKFCHDRSSPEKLRTQRANLRDVCLFHSSSTNSRVMNSSPS
jgi:hypothetical protein